MTIFYGIVLSFSMNDGMFSMILTVPQNIVMNLNNLMLTSFGFVIINKLGCIFYAFVKNDG